MAKRKPVLEPEVRAPNANVSEPVQTAGPANSIGTPSASMTQVSSSTTFEQIFPTVLIFRLHPRGLAQEHSDLAPTEAGMEKGR